MTAPARPGNGNSPKWAKSIYLAGKISKNDWRHQAVPGLRGAWGDELSNGLPAACWPVLENAIGGYFDYTGPYCASDDHGCFHCPASHGCADCIDGYDTLPRGQVVKYCLDAISRSDLVFAWIDGLSGYGTLAEIGYARGIGKRILLVTPDPPDFTRCSCGHGCGGCDNGRLAELWFTFELADQVLTRPDPVSALLELAAQVAALAAADVLQGEASPIERAFWDAHRRLGLPELGGLVFQHPALNYRIDFALPDRRIGIELDGFASHSSTADIARDRMRQRALEAAGWRIIRFGGAEVHRDAGSCVVQAAALIRSLRNGDRP
jgi:very-short-patch-repair endonuclease